jgi:hypothetical protein
MTVGGAIAATDNYYYDETTFHMSLIATLYDVTA